MGVGPIPLPELPPVWGTGVGRSTSGKGTLTLLGQPLIVLRHGYFNIFISYL